MLAIDTGCFRNVCTAMFILNNKMYHYVTLPVMHFVFFNYGNLVFHQRFSTNFQDTLDCHHIYHGQTQRHEKAAPKEPEPPASSKKGKELQGSRYQQQQHGAATERAQWQVQASPMNPEARRAVTNSVSWTGKLPATLLHEHCQKQKWEKLQFDMKGGPDKGFVAIAVLAKKNVKTGQVETVRMMPPSDIFPLQKTPLEARHIAATYGLHRVASHRNMKPMLPPDHRDYWSKLDDLKSSI